MADTLKTLVRMANQIADFHQPYSFEQAVAGVHTHLKKFWTPVMLRELAAHIATGKADVRPSVVAAFELFGKPKGETAAKAADPKELDEIRDDAG
jgi:formate dehydrogenase subunit delta